MRQPQAPGSRRRQRRSALTHNGFEIPACYSADARPSPISGPRRVPKRAQQPPARSGAATRGKPPEGELDRSEVARVSERFSKSFTSFRRSSS